MTLSPNGRMAAVVGADAGTVTVRISDSGGNPVAGVTVGVERPAALTLVRTPSAKTATPTGW